MASATTPEACPDPQRQPGPDSGRAGYLSQWLSEALLDLVFGGVAYAPPRTLWFGLSKVPANPVGLVVEPGDPEYRRFAVPNDLGHFPAAGLFGGFKANSFHLAWPLPRQSYGKIRSVLIADGPDLAARIMATIDITPRRADRNAGAPLLAAAGLGMRLL